ncbi:SDR family oxidoreductase [Tabrizicola sp. BL-A-41-H6]|uniref:SDR family oxidoreductase n=1 Tax=Tabrizicola sp. BL-A-41-H6 TaxID=3421107 RepID=UPI003D6683BD
MPEDMPDRPPQTQDHQPGHETEMTPAPDYLPRYPGSGRLAGKTAFITGGDSGIGRATAILFAREGARVAIHYRNETEDAATTLEAIRAEGAEGIAIKGDISDPDEVTRAVRETLKRFGRVNIVMNNAAVQYPQETLEAITAEQLETTFATNILSQFHVVKGFLSQMESGDCIINTTSVTAFRGSDHLVDYASTKGAILAFTRALSGMLAPRGIRVNAIAPGPIWTPLIPASFDAEKVASFGKDTPLGRAGQPCEVAPAALFLACEDSSYMTGQTLHPNGGEMVGG